MNPFTVLATGPNGPAEELALLRANLALALEQILAVARGEVPAHAVNPAAIPRWRARRATP
jgi:hypothetical protein